MLRKIFLSRWFLPIFIFLLAAAFRLPLLQYSEFKGDEALNLLLATRPLFHHAFPPASQASSAGILNFPLLNYLLLPIVIFTTYPPSIALVIALLNALTVSGFFLLFRKYHGALTAALSSCILALSPWAILYSRKIWAQDFLLPLSLPFFFSLYKIIEGKKAYWFLFGATSMLLMQLHQLGIFIPLTLFLGLLISKHKPRWTFLFYGIIVGLTPTIPYFWYAASQHFSIFQATNSLSDRFSFHSLETFLRPLQIISIGNFHTEMGSDFALFASQFHFIYLFSKTSYLAYIFLPLGLLFFWIKQKQYRSFVGTTIATLILYFLIGIEPLMHYFILLLPFFALFVGFLLSSIFHNKKWVLLGIVLSVLYLGALTLFDYGFLTLLSQKGGFSGDYGAGFITSEKSVQQDLKQFRKNPDYKELQLFYFAPTEYFHGYMPVGKMIFPYNDLQKDEWAREKVFIQQSSNPLIATEVFAYYTQSNNPSWDYVISLKEKARLHGAYSFIYQKVLNEYLDQHLKRLYETPDFVLLYPHHWSANKILGGAELTDGSVAVDITLASQSDPTAIFLRANYYTMSVKIIKQNTTDKDKLNTYAQNSFEEIKKSIRALK